ncbi:MAG: hypothetical protein ACKVHQ_09790 [Gammaproteobacteria bacterium]
MTTEDIPEDTTEKTSPEKLQSNGWRTFGIVVITMVLTLGIG